MTGTLYVIALPIGNLEDITIRAIRILRSVDGILAEDTRVTKRVLDRYRIETPFFSSVFQGGEKQRSGWLIEQIHAGNSLALVSDAGTPLISDPGYPLVRAAVAGGVPVVPIPGSSAVLCGLIASGLPTDRFCFDGAIPRRSGERRALFERLRFEPRTVVLFESPHRLLASLEDLSAVLPDRSVALGRELTKQHEEFLRGTAKEIHATLRARPAVKGECVLVLSGSPALPRPDSDRIDRVLETLHEAELPAKTIVRTLVSAFGIARNEAYELAHRGERNPED